MTDKTRSTFVPNSFQTPNAYVDDLMYLLSGEELKVLIYADRRILGFQKRQDRISISQFTDGIKDEDGEPLDHGTGLGIETVKRCLASLVEFGLMVRLEENDPKTNKGVLWSLQWDTGKVNWQALEERKQQKAKVNAGRIAKARSVRQAHPKRQTPISAAERTPTSPTDPPSTSGTETQKTEEIQRKTGMVANAADPTSFEKEVSNSGKSTATNIGISAMPEDVQETVRAFIEITGLKLPAQPPRKGKGGDWALWIKGARELDEHLDEHDRRAVLEAAFEASYSGKTPMTISHPGALRSFVIAEVGRLNLQKRAQAERDTYINLGIPSDWGEKVRSLSPSELPTNQDILAICQEQDWKPLSIPDDKFWLLWFARLEEAKVAA